MSTVQKILAGRTAVNTYRVAHMVLCQKPYYKQVHDDHTPLLVELVDTLEKEGFTSTQTEFESKKTEILAKFWRASNAQCLADTGVYDHEVYRLRKDLEMLAEPVEFEGVELVEANMGRQLIIDEKVVMDTSPEEHISMLNSVADCPDDAKVFIAGLGLGVVLLYLAESGKASQITVCEIESRVISLLGQRITDYLDVPIQVIQGDAFLEIWDLGKFNWIFFDVGSPKQDKLDLTDHLEIDGVYTNWSKKMYQPRWR